VVGRVGMEKSFCLGVLLEYRCPFLMSSDATDYAISYVGGSFVEWGRPPSVRRLRWLVCDGDASAGRAARSSAPALFDHPEAQLSLGETTWEEGTQMAPTEEPTPVISVTAAQLLTTGQCGPFPWSSGRSW
jgi:hypothetical protein